MSAIESATRRPVLLVGGSGVVGSRAARELRRLQPELPIVIGGRDLERAGAVAEQVGGATAARVDLERPDLGLPAGSRLAAVVALLKDPTLASLRYAQRHAVPYVSFADWVFDIAPEVALFVHRPASAPVLLLGHVMGGTIALVALHHASQLRAVRSIAIAGLFHDDDTGGPTAAADWERLARVPLPFVLAGGKFAWAAGDLAARSFVDAAGIQRTGKAYPMLDVASLAAATGASSVRVDFAVREAAARAPGQGPSIEVIIEIEGERPDGSPGRLRVEILDDDVHARLSARGAALAIERLIGLAGGPPVRPGLYGPENLLDPAHAVERLRALGTEIRSVS